MLHKTEGIILRTYKYSETSIIARIFTREFGIQSYIISGVRSAKGKGKAGALRTPNILELVAYHKEAQGLQRMKEFKAAFIYQNLPFDITKSSIGIFAAELLLKTLHLSEPASGLFDYAKSFLQDVDRSKHNSLHPLHFMVNLCGFLGFALPQETQEGLFFDLKEGSYKAEEPAHSYFLKPSLAGHLQALSGAALEDLEQMNISKSERKLLLNGLMSYYIFHHEGFSGLKSLSVLEEVLG